MTKLTLTNLVNLQNETTAVNAINTNNDAIVDAIDNTLSRDGTSPNQMNAVLDMNSNQIINLPAPSLGSSPVRKQDIQADTFPTNVDFPIGLDQGGTGQDMSNTGGANEFVKQLTPGGLFTVAAITLEDIEDVLPTPPSATPTVLASDFSSTTFDSTTLSVSTIGYNTLGIGNANYFRVVSEPSHMGRLRSADRFLPDGSTDSVNGGWWCLSATLPTPLMFGAVQDGSTDDSTALTNLFTYVTAVSGQWQGTPGTTFISSAVTLTGIGAFSPGFVLKPAASITVTLSNLPQAGLYKIFDISASSSFVKLPSECQEVWAEWWGALGDNTKTDNDVPFQQAINALQFDEGFTIGGVVRCGRGTFLFSSSVSIANNVVVRGQNCRWTRFTVNNSTWSGTDTFWLFQNGGHPQFNCRLEEIEIECSANVSINQVIYSDCWNEQCGLRNMLINNFCNVGVFVEHGYGGTATFELNNVEIFMNTTGAASATGKCCQFSTDSTGNYTNIILTHMVMSGNSPSQTSQIGVNCAGGVLTLVCNGIHFEDIEYGFNLTGTHNVVGNGITGGPSVNAVFDTSSSGTWSGQITALGVKKGSASQVIFGIQTDDNDNNVVSYPNAI